MKKKELYKKVLPKDPLFHPILKRALIMFNWSLILTFLLSTQVYAVSYPQTARVDLNLKSTTLKKALTVLEQRSDIRLLYSEEYLPNKEVSLVSKDMPVLDALSEILKETNLNYREFGDGLVVIISPEGVVVQDILVRGKVVDSQGEPLIGVSIRLQGTPSGVTTDINGNFSIETPENGVLVFSYIGFINKEVPVASRTSIQVQLDEDNQALSEVVVVGYGRQKKALVTGATTNLSSEDLEKTRMNSPLQAMQGQTPGMQILSNSGQPGTGLKVIVRGLGTIGNSDPLYIVDGVQVSNIDHITVQDIASIDILKDAASAAIYGSQAANGVVLVTTKAGSLGKPKVTIDSYFGVNTVARHVETLDASQYMMIMNEAASYDNLTPYFTEAQINSAGKGIDWVKEMYYDKPITQNHNLGISGGSETSTYFLSLGYTGEQGIIGGPDVSNYERYSIRLNSDHNLNKYVTVGQRLSFNYRNQRGIQAGGQYGNRFRDAFQTTPILPMYDDEGNWFNNVAGTMYNGEPWKVWYADDFNPYARMILEDQTRSNNQDVLGNLYINVKPFEGFSFRSSFGLDYRVGESRGYLPEFQLSWERLNERSRATQSLNKRYSWTFDNVATYDFTLSREHDVSLMAGMSAQRNDIGSSINAQNTNLILPGFDYSWVTNATNSDLAYMSFNGSPYTENSLLSYFGRINYAYKEKYLLTATYRMDGTSRFSRDQRWGYFPSVSAGWVMSSESFMDNIEWLNFFKPRGSWGQVGNQNVAPYQYMSPISIDGNNNNAYFGSELTSWGGVTVGSRADRLANPNLKWETSEQLNFGLDAYLLNSRLGVVFDWYNKTTKDWIVTPPVLATVGTGAPAINGGNVENRGIELGLSWRDRVSTDFGYNFSANLNTNRNKVLSVPTPDGIIHGDGNTLYHNSAAYYRLAETGFPIAYFWGLETDGIFQNESEVLKHVNSEGKVIQPNAKPGDLRYVDQDNSGNINTTDNVMIGNPYPKVSFGFSTGFDYKGFDLSVSASGVAGNDIIKVYRNYARSLPNYPVTILDRWHGEGTSNTVPRVTLANINHQPSDYLLEKGDYLRISNLTIGYDLTRVLTNSFFSNLRVYGSVNNLYTFTKYTGSDPEIGYAPSSASAGSDLGYYPRPRTIMMGINLTF